MLISVIIPIYNTEKYLKKCIDSVICQTYKNLEIILVNDGSTDNSLNICNEYKNKDTRIKVINKKNSGSSATRNMGIKNSNGQYLLFLDSDDWYKYDDMIESLVKTAKRYSSDLVIFNYCRDNGKPVIQSNQKIITNTQDIVNNNAFTSSACLKLTNRNLVVANDIFFEEDRLTEDILFAGKILCKAENIVFINKAYYNYTIREGSTTQKIRAKNVIDLLHSIEQLENLEGDIIKQYTAFQYATILINMNLCIEKLDDNLINKIYAKKYLLSYNNIKQVKIIYWVYKIVGIKNASKMLTLYFKRCNRN